MREHLFILHGSTCRRIAVSTDIPQFSFDRLGWIFGNTRSRERPH